jgi:hypothetical protein
MLPPLAPSSPGCRHEPLVFEATREGVHHQAPAQRGSSASSSSYLAASSQGAYPFRLSLYRRPNFTWRAFFRKKRAHLAQCFGKRLGSTRPRITSRRVCSQLRAWPPRPQAATGDYGGPRETSGDNGRHRETTG